MSSVLVQSERRVATIDVNQIRESKEALRGIDRNNPQYVELAEQVRLTGGPLSAISVREFEDTETGETYYSLIDGLQRLTATRDAGLPTIAATIMPVDDFNTLIMQVIANTSRVETKPAEYSKQLQLILQANPTMSSMDLAGKLGKTTEWIKQRLGLVNLVAEAARLVDAGNINLTNAYALAKLPPEEQGEYVEQAQSATISDFNNVVVQRLSAIKEAKKKGGSSDVVTVFKHKPYLHKIGEVVEEAETCAFGNATIAAQRLVSAEDGWKAALLWASMSDPDSVAKAKAKWDAEEAIRAEKKQKSAAERDRRKLLVADIKKRRAELEMKLSEEGASDEDRIAALVKFDTENKPPTSVKADAAE